MRSSSRARCSSVMPSLRASFRFALGWRSDGLTELDAEHRVRSRWCWRRCISTSSSRATGVDTQLRKCKRFLFVLCDRASFAARSSPRTSAAVQPYFHSSTTSATGNVITNSDLTPNPLYANRTSGNPLASPIPSHPSSPATGPIQKPLHHPLHSGDTPNHPSLATKLSSTSPSTARSTPAFPRERGVEEREERGGWRRDRE